MSFTQTNGGSSKTSGSDYLLATHNDTTYDVIMQHETAFYWSQF